jgi:hypothetical protein
MRGKIAEMSSPSPPEPKPRYQRKTQWQQDKEEEERKQQVLQAEAEKKMHYTDDNFPALGNSSPTVKVWGEKKSFAALAGEWESKAKLDELEQQKKEKEEQDILLHRRMNMPLPRFHNVHRFVEPEDAEDEMEPDEEVQQTTNPEDEGWTTVDRKKRRREKTIEEKLARPPTPENSDTVWNGDDLEDHETCWDSK